MPNPPSQEHPARDADDAPEGFLFDHFTVDLSARRLLCNAEVVALPSRVFDVLVLLIEHRERSVQKDEIISAIWDNVVVTDDSLIHAISVLRRALADDPHHPKYIETIPRRGYRFIGAVRPAFEAQSGHEAAPNSGSQTETEPTQGEVPVPVPPGFTPAGGVRARQVTTLALGATAAILVLAITLALVILLQDGPSLQESGFDASVRLYQTAPPGTGIVSTGALSPDSSYLAFIARDNSSGHTGLWIRNLRNGNLRRIQGAENASMPFWAPDSTQLGYFANGRLVTSDLYGENMRVIASVTGAAGATWSSDNNILFAEWARGLYSVSAMGDGLVQPVLTLERDARDIAFAWPQFFPDSRRFLYQIASLDSERAGAYIGHLDTLQSFKLLDTGSSATLAPPRHVLYQQRDMLIAEELDPQRFELTGHAVVIARGLSEPGLATDNFVSASAELLAFQQGSVQQSLAWYDRGGQQLQVLEVPTLLFNPRLSPRGDLLLVSSSVTTDPGLWLISLDNEHVTRIEVDAVAPVWSPDGTWIAYTSRDGGEILLRSVESEEGPITVTSDDSVKILGDWTPDGTALVYTRQSEGGGLDLWIVDVGTGVSQPLLVSDSGETQARISPDGNWIAYSSDESGAMESYVARFPGFEDRRRISSSGGGQAQWRQDQQELFYLSPDKVIMGVAVTMAEDIVLSEPYPLFRTAIAGDPRDARESFTMNASGTRFLVDNRLNGDSEEQIAVMVNWAARTREGSSGQAQ